MGGIRTDERASDVLKAEARGLGCARLQLDSGTFRKDAHAFYLREGVRIEAFHLGIAR